MAGVSSGRLGAPLLFVLFILLLAWTLASPSAYPGKPRLSPRPRPVAAKRATRFHVSTSSSETEVEALRQQVASLQAKLAKRESDECSQGTIVSAPPTTNLEEYDVVTDLVTSKAFDPMYTAGRFNLTNINAWDIDKVANEMTRVRQSFMEYKLKAYQKKIYLRTLRTALEMKRELALSNSLSNRTLSDEFSIMRRMRQSILDQGSTWPLKLWSGKDHCKSWQGVKCIDKTVGWVSSIHFPGLLRKLPDEVGDLNWLVKIIADDVELEELSPHMVRAPLKVLRLSNNRLTHIPDYIFGSMPALAHFKVRANHIADIPQSFQKSPMLSHFDIRKNRIGNISSLKMPPRLRRLDLSLNNIEYLPQDFGEGGVSLSKLALSGNPLRELPKGIMNLASLRGLSLDNCSKLKSLPKELGKLTQLKQLYIYMSSIETLPAELGMVPLKNLHAFQSRLRVLPPKLFSGILQQTLVDFNCVGCPLKELPDTFGGMWALEVLNLQSVGLERLPPLSGLVSLKELVLKHNMFTKFPEGMEALVKLVYIDLSNNPLEEIPDVFALLQSLDTLVLSGTMIKKLPPSISRLSALEHFDVSNSRLEELPDDIGMLRSLSFLEVGENYIRKIPESLADLELLQELRIDRNMLEVLENIPYQNIQVVDAKGNKFLRRMEWSRSPRLLSIDLSDCALEEVPIELGWSPEVKDIVFSNNGMRRFLPSFVGMPKIEVIRLEHNRLESFTLFDDAMNADESVRWGDLMLIELFANRLSSGVSAESIAKVFERSGQSGMSLSIENNLLFGIYENSTSVEPFPSSAEVWMDMRALGSSNDMSDMLRSGQSLSQLSYSNRPSQEVEEVAKKLLATEESLKWSSGSSWASHSRIQCSELSSHFMTRILRLRECHCATGFYRLARSYKGEIRDSGECVQCVNDAKCHHDVVECFGGFYLDFEDGGPTCRMCPPGAQCSENRVVAKPGYWQSPNSSRVFSCPLSSSCLGGSTETNSTSCTDGHYGPLCSLCRYNHYKDSYGSCSSCPSLVASVIYAVTMALGVLGVLLALAFLGDGRVRGMTARQDSVDMFQSVNVTGSVSEGASMLRILVGFLQVVTVFPSVYQVNWEALAFLAEGFRWINFDFLSASSLECVWEHLSDFNSDVEGVQGRLFSVYSFYESMLLMALIPILVSVLCAMVACIYSAGYKAIKPLAGVTTDSVNRFMFRVILLTALLAYLPVSNMVFQFFKCWSFDGGATKYVSADLSLECYNARWMMYLPVALAILVFYTAGLPAIILLVLVPKSRGYFTVHDGEQKTHWWSKMHWVIEMTARTFSVYKKKYMWWDAVELGRKLLITAVALHFAEAGTVQVAIALCICFGAVVLHLLTLPFESRLLNSLQLTQLVLVYMSLSIGVLKSLDVSEENRNSVANFIIILDGIFILAGFAKVSQLMVLTGLRLGPLKKVRGKLMNHV